MKVIVCGGRSFVNYDALERYLDTLHALHRFTLVMHGAARGADSLADHWAKSRHIDVKRFHADWKLHRKAAGVIRNQEMLDEGPAMVIAFPGGKGTANMKMLASKAGVPVIDLQHNCDLTWQQTRA